MENNLRWFHSQFHISPGFYKSGNTVTVALCLELLTGYDVIPSVAISRDGTGFILALPVA